MVKWISHIDERERKSFPCAKYYHIIHEITGECLAVETGERSTGARIVTYAPPRDGKVDPQWKDYPGAVEWRFEAVTSADGNPSIEREVRNDLVSANAFNGLTKVGPLLLINRRSGLPLTMGAAKDGVASVQQELDPDIHETSGAAGSGVVTLKASAAGVLRDGAGCVITVSDENGDLYYLNIQEDKPGGRVAEVTMRKEDKLGSGARVHWRLHPAVSTPYLTAGKDKTYKLELDEVGVGYAYAHEALNMLSDLAGTVGNIGNTIGGEEGEAVGVIAYAISGLFKLTDHIVNFVQISDEASREDPLQTLYKTMMPEIKDIMKSQLIEDNVTDAIGEAKAASLAWRTVSQALYTYAQSQTNGAQKMEKGPWVFEAMPERQRARISDLLSQSDEHFRSALAVLMTPRNAQEGLANFVPISAEHTAVATLLTMLYPDVDGSNFKGFLETYRFHVARTWETLKQERVEKIGTDLRDRQLKGAPYMADLEVARMNAARSLDLDLGQPTVAIRNWQDMIEA